MTRIPTVFAAILLTMISTSWASDWRIDLLKESGIDTSEAELKKTAGSKANQEELEKAFEKLGSESYPERVKAQKALIAGGVSTLEFLRKKKDIKNAEARARAAEIEKELKTSDLIGRQNMIELARSSLLEHRNAKDTGGFFYEWFGTDTKHCDAGYRSFIFDAADRHSAWVDKGQLRLLGRRHGEVDQQMVLKSKAWPNSDKLPDRFSITARVGGESAGRGLWHVGISIGRVKALFHPGYAGGAFRFEQVGTLEKYVGNKDMGFTPKNGELYPMTILVERRKNDIIKITATIDPDDHPAFQESVELNIDQFGSFDQISLDRSGNPGGDAIFDDLMIDLNPR